MRQDAEAYEQGFRLGYEKGRDDVLDYVASWLDEDTIEAVKETFEVRS